MTETLTATFEDRSTGGLRDATITLGLDRDDNPYNGVFNTAVSALTSSLGSDTLNANLPTGDVAGAFRVYAKITNGTRTRYYYAPGRASITVPGYAAAKSGIAGLTKALANEWAAHGVNVNAIAPGYIATDNTAALQADQARSRSILDRIPAARWGRPEDIAGATVFLASSASDYVNGIVLPVDGGWLGR